MLPAVATSTQTAQDNKLMRLDKTIVDALEIVLDEIFVLGRNDNDINFANSYGRTITSG